MKKSFLTSLAIASLALGVSYADPTALIVDVTCPSTTGVSNVITNFGDHIRGAGTVAIDNITGSQSAYFNYNIPSGASIPHKLTTYSNSGTDYDPVLSEVSCSYSSSVAGEDPFTATYKAENFKGGSIDTSTQTVNTIRIYASFGLKK